jgi:mono/diheme cytochrome c family protein
VAKKRKQRRPRQQPQRPPQRRREAPAPAPAAPAGWSTARKTAVGAAAVAVGIGIFAAVVLTQRSNSSPAAAPTTTAPTVAPAPTSTESLAKRFGPLTGKRLFAVYCGVCHVLADAGAQGQDGPDLDLMRPSKARVLRAIARGGRGSGIMPAHIFRGKRAAQVAAYVARATRKDTR